MTAVVVIVAGVVVLEVIVEIVESGDEVMVRDVVVVVDVDVVICHDHHDYYRTRPLSMNKNCYYYYYDCCCCYSDDDDDCAFVASAGTIGWQRRPTLLAPDSHSRNCSSTFWSVSSFCAPCSHTCHGGPS